MTANERWFHLIGFIDAIVSFQRGNLFKNPETLKQELTETYFEDGEPLDEKDLSDYQEGLVLHVAYIAYNDVGVKTPCLVNQVAH